MAKQGMLWNIQAYVVPDTGVVDVNQEGRRVTGDAGSWVFGSNGERDIFIPLVKVTKEEDLKDFNYMVDDDGCYHFSGDMFSCTVIIKWITNPFKKKPVPQGTLELSQKDVVLLNQMKIKV